MQVNVAVGHLVDRTEQRAQPCGYCALLVDVPVDARSHVSAILWRRVLALIKGGSVHHRYGDDRTPECRHIDRLHEPYNGSCPCNLIAVRGA